MVKQAAGPLQQGIIEMADKIPLEPQEAYTAGILYPDRSDSKVYLVIATFCSNNQVKRKLKILPLEEVLANIENLQNITENELVNP